MTSIYIQNGTTAQYVDALTNQTGTMDPILAVNPPRGTEMVLLNEVAQGEQRLGVPITMKLRDDQGNLLPVNTEFRAEVEMAGMSDPVAVSARLEDISAYNTLSVTEQRNTDTIDATKLILQNPETQGGDPVPYVSWRDIDEFRFAIESAQAVDWSQSELTVMGSAVKGPFQRGD
jgi:hypothetical protein